MELHLNDNADFVIILQVPSETYRSFNFTHDVESFGRDIRLSSSEALRTISAVELQCRTIEYSYSIN